MPNHITLPSADADPIDATLVFHEQADGRKVSRLAGGKVVLVDLIAMDRVKDGEAWYVKLRHKDTFAIADPIERVTAATLDSTGALTSPFADALARARTIEARRPAPSSPVDHVDKAAVGTPPPIAPTPASETPHQATTGIDLARIVRTLDRIALFIDGANMDGAARHVGYFVDFRKAREFFLAAGSFYAGFYYLADFSATDPVQLRFMDFLSHSGFIVRRRAVKVIRDQDTGERIIKGNLDTEMVLDMLNTLDNYDVAFLFSGDSDFERAVDLLRARGKRVYVVSARAQLSRELAHIADKPIFYLDDLQAPLARDRRGEPAGRQA